MNWNIRWPHSAAWNSRWHQLQTLYGVSNTVWISTDANFPLIAATEIYDIDASYYIYFFYTGEFDCPPGKFNEAAESGSDCVNCFCFGHGRSTDCDSSGMYMTQVLSSLIILWYIISGYIRSYTNQVVHHSDEQHHWKLRPSSVLIQMVIQARTQLRDSYQSITSICIL